MPADLTKRSIEEGEIAQLPQLKSEHEVDQYLMSLYELYGVNVKVEKATSNFLPSYALDFHYTASFYYGRLETPFSAPSEFFTMRGYGSTVPEARSDLLLSVIRMMPNLKRVLSF